MKFYLIRHGETNWNLEGRIQGGIDVGLNERGRRQAQDAGKHISAEQVFDIASSPLRRAYQTAEIISKNVEVGDFRVIKQFREFDQGFWNGLRVRQLLDDLEPERYRLWQEKPLEYPPPGGDSLERLRERVKEGIGELLTVSSRPQLIVAHKVVNSMIAHLAGDWSLEDVMVSLPDNAAIYSVEIEEV
ncbi:MAG: histidine phosphatase family protein [bacterium]